MTKNTQSGVDSGIVSTVPGKSGVAKMPKDLSMRLRPADRKNIGRVVSWVRKHSDLGRSATVSDCIRFAFAMMAEQLTEQVTTFAPATTPEA